VRVHLKDFTLKRGEGRFDWVNLGEGDIDWPEVRRAFNEINYDGFMTTEIEGGDKTYLADVSKRFDRFLAGQKPVTT
jgi:hexulose-6-phosphate isomerase